MFLLASAVILVSGAILLGSLLTTALPQTYADVRIDASCYLFQSIAEPCTGTNQTAYMYGMVDIGFTPDPPSRLCLKPNRLPQPSRRPIWQKPTRSSLVS